MNLLGSLGIVNEKPTRKTCFFPWKEAPSFTYLPSKILPGGVFFEVNGISIIFSREVDVKTG